MSVKNDISFDQFYEEEDFLSALALKTAVWQYLMDHAMLMKDGVFKISFFTKDSNQFWGHVQARNYGKYKRADLQKLYAKQQAKLGKMFSLEKANNKLSIACNRIDNEGSLIEKVVLYLYRKSKKYLTKS